MNFLSIFDVIGPNMIGPSSSHTAGAVSIALMARKLFSEDIQKVTFTLYGSFAKTYRGHGTDRALLGGILGFPTYDERIRDAFEHAEEMGVEYKYIIDEQTVTNHPNTADIDLVGVTGRTMSIRGESIGGGKMKIVRIDGIDVEFTGEYSTLIVRQIDKPGVVAHITQALSEHNVNIAFMRLFREDKGATAYTVVESDEAIPETVLEQIRSNKNVSDLMLIQI
ncbi:MAG: L-serine ammonia-lyase, iron-sulfur-dependent subunit beta [Tyzzerella sp.]|nr:L-serine ammonia-lyase, iron-sulfur-dependent subunit beta [Tyzzerella sp.]